MINTDNFTGKAEAYAKGRPGYPRMAIDYICSLIPWDAVFADIGAGTGKFTVKLAERGYSVYAVEPNADMRGQLTITLAPFPNVKVIDGTAEATTLPDHSADILTVAHALHWFDLSAFQFECRRVVRPGGLVVVIYNHLPGRGSDQFYQQTVNAFFSNPVTREFSNPIDFTRDKWLAYMASMDDVPFPGDPGYDTYIAKMNVIFDRNSVDGLLHNDRVTRVYSEMTEMSL